MTHRPLQAFGLFAVVVLCACAPATQTTAPSDDTSAAVSLPPEGDFDYQLGGAYEPSSGTVIVVRDSTEDPAADVYNVCYINGFQTQPGESQGWGALRLLREGEPVADPDWPDEDLLDTSTANNRTAIADRLTERINDCAEAGFDAVEFDNLDSFQRSGGALTSDDNLALATMLIDRAHRAGLATAQKNTVEFVTQGRAAGFDFAITEECGAYEECQKYLAAYDIVLDIEYGDPDSFTELCANGTLPPNAILRDLDLLTPDDAGYVLQRCS